MLCFHVKFVQSDRRTDGKTISPPPDLSIRGHKIKKKKKTDLSLQPLILNPLLHTDFDTSTTDSF